MHERQLQLDQALYQIGQISKLAAELLHWSHSWGGRPTYFAACCDFNAYFDDIRKHVDNLETIISGEMVRAYASNQKD